MRPDKILGNNLRGQIFPGEWFGWFVYTCRCRSEDIGGLSHPEWKWDKEARAGAFPDLSRCARGGHTTVTGVIEPTRGCKTGLLIKTKSCLASSPRL